MRPFSLAPFLLFYPRRISHRNMAWALIGALCSCGLLLFFYGCADTLFLSLAHARLRPEGGRFIERVRNLCFRHRFPKVRVFVSNRVEKNIYLLDSIFRSPSLLIHPEIENLDSVSLEALIEGALKQMAHRRALHALVCSFLFALVESPAHRSTDKKVFFYGGMGYAFLLMPLRLLKDTMTIRTSLVFPSSRPFSLKKFPPSWWPSLGGSLLGRVGRDIQLVRSGPQGVKIMTQ